MNTTTTTNRYLKRTDLLTEVRDCIINNPQRFTYQMWFKRGNLYHSLGKQMQCNDNWCGTMACVAGHVIALSCPPELTMYQFMCTTEDSEDYSSESTVANKILEINNYYAYDIKEFLYSPWYWKDKNENYLISEIDDYPDLAIAEAVRRINWILEDKPLEDYVIEEPLLIEPGDLETQD